MENVLLKLVGEAPYLVAVIVVVVLFLRHIRHDQLARRGEQTAFLTALKLRDARSEVAAKRNHKTQRETVVALDRSTRQHERTEQALTLLSNHLPPHPSGS